MIKYIKSKNVYEVYTKDNHVYSYSKNRYGKYAKNIAMISDQLSKRLNNYYIFKKRICIIKIYSKKYDYVFDVKIDKKDFNKVKNFKWYIRKNNNTFYCESRIPNSDKRIKIHNIILNSKELIDHKNRNGLDNRHKNLRIVTTSINGRNIKCINKNEFNGVNKIKIKDYYYYESRYIDNNGKIKTKKFNINKYGEELSKSLAIVNRYKNSIKYGYLYSKDELKVVKKCLEKIKEKDIV